MIITVTSFKGGVGKTTTAVHLACYLKQTGRDVLLVDGDDNRSCIAWTKRGELPIKVVDERAAPKYARNYENIIIDTAARPEKDELEALADGCDLLLLPTTPDAMAIDALSLTIGTLKSLGVKHYKVLLTIIPPKPTKDGDEARAILEEAGIPLFKDGVKRLIIFQRAALQGKPVYTISDQKSKEAWGLYENIGKEVLSCGR